MDTIKSRVDNILKWALVVIMGAMVINVLWQVFTRFVMQDPSSYTEELARYMLIWIGILGASYVAGQKMHLAIDLLATSLKGKSKIYVNLFIDLCVLVFAASVMVVGGSRLVFITLKLNQISAALQIPLGFVYTVLPLSGVLIVFYSVYFISKEIIELKTAK